MPMVSMPFALTASKQPIARKLFAHYGWTLIALRLGGPRAIHLYPPSRSMTRYEGVSFAGRLACDLL